jgi:pimeloyl-ACP methyl ester carboxylesterase
MRTDLPGVIAGMVDRFLPEPNIEHLKRWTRHIGGRSDPTAAVAAQEAMVAADVRPLLPSVAVPTLLVHGALDSAVPLSVAQENMAGIPRSKLVVLEGTGHGPTVTRPRDVADAIDQQFVRR